MKFSKGFKRTKKSLLGLAISLVLIVGLVPSIVFAAEGGDEQPSSEQQSEVQQSDTTEAVAEPQIEQLSEAGKQNVSAKDPQAEVSYIDASGNTQKIGGAEGSDYTVIDASSATQVTWNAGWYVVEGNITLSKGAVCNGAVNIILKDGCTLTVTAKRYEAGIIVSGEGKSLAVYGQSGQTGVLSAKGDTGGAGIGGNNMGSGSYITINGGAVTATGGDGGAGIGGGAEGSGSGSNITINGGTVTATGGVAGAGIGGGAGRSGSNITINGGAVTATGGNLGAGIGNGSGATTAASNIKIAATLAVKADGSNPPTTAIAHTSAQDIASDLAGKQYVTAKEPQAEVSYIDASGNTQKIGGAEGSDYTVIDASSATQVTWSAGWYVVEGGTEAAPLTIAGAVCNGAVNLILKDGCNLNVTGAQDCAGICVSGDGNSLAIYGQSAGENVGKLSANGGKRGAGIGGNSGKAGSYITINGGNVTATGGFNGGNGGAGIGGGDSGSGTYITINGGVVTAKGGGSNGAGIGGGQGKGGSGDHITINGGTVTATGGNYGAGIGGGYQASGSNITINGGNVTAASKNSAGIGNGNSCSTAASNIKVAAALVVKAGNSANPTKVITHDATTDLSTVADFAGKKYVTVEQPQAEVSYIDASGNTQKIGGAEGSDYTVINASSATQVTWAAGWYVVEGGTEAAPLTIAGAVCNGAVHLILKDGCNLKVTSAQNYAGICVSGEGKSLVIYGQSVGENAGKLAAKGGYYGAGIGGNKQASGSNITINGGSVSARGGGTAAGIGGGSGGTGSKITINGGNVTAEGVMGSAGIGGGSGGTGSNITINGGNVTATGNIGGAGIGGGNNGTGSYITITGGNVTATGGDSSGSAGIGGGSASNIKVAATLAVKADGSNPPTTAIVHTSDQDIASDLAGKKYVTVSPMPPITLGAQTGTLTYGTASSATYSVTQYPESPAFTNHKILWKNSEGAFVETAPSGVTASLSSDTKTLTVNTTAAANAGNYTFKVTAKNSDKDVSSPEATLAVGAKNISICTISEIAEQTYTGSQITPDVTVKDGSTTLTTSDYELSYDTNKDAGTAAGKVTVTGKGNYSSTKDVTFDIAQKTLTVSSTTASDKLYDGTYTATVTPGTLQGAVQGDAVSIDGASGEFDDANAGNNKKVTVIYTLAGASAGNYKVENETVYASITKRSVTLTSADGSKKYDGTALTNSNVTVSGDGFVSGQGATYDVTGSQTAVGSSSNTFTYELNDGTSKDNYTISTANGTLTVTANDTLITITADSNSKTYDGTALTDDGYTYTGKLGAGDSFTSVTVTGSITNFGTSANTVTDWVVKNQAGDDVTDFYTNFSTADGTLTITKRSVTLTSADGSKKYDGTALTNDTVTVSGDGFVSGQGATYDVTGSQTAVGSSPNAFTYTLSTGTSADNYNVSTANGTLTVAANDTPITITADSDSKMYDGTALTDDGYTYTGALGTGDYFASVTVTGSITNFGTAANTVTDWVVKNQAGDDVTDYYTNFSTADGTLTITKRSVTLKSDSASKTLDGTPLVANEVTVSGDEFVSGEGATYDVTGSQTTVGSSDNAFTYNLNEGTSADNYIITKVYGTLTVYSADSKEPKVNSDDLDKVKEAFAAMPEYAGKTITAKMEISSKASSDDVAKIKAKIGNKKLVSFGATLIVSADGEAIKNAGDINNTLVSITYDFDFTKKADIQTWRAHTNSIGETTVDMLTEKANKDGEFVTYDKKAGTITVTAKKYSTYCFAYSDAADEQIVAKTGDSALLVLAGLAAVAAAAAGFVLAACRCKQQ